MIVVFRHSLFFHRFAALLSLPLSPAHAVQLSQSDACPGTQIKGARKRHVVRKQRKLLVAHLLGVPRDVDGNNFRGEMTCFPGIGGSALVAFNSVCVLCFAGEFEICRRLNKTNEFITRELCEMHAVVVRKQRKLLVAVLLCVHA